MGLPITHDQQHRAPAGPLRASLETGGFAFSAAVADFVPAATPSDIAALSVVDRQTILTLRRVVIQATADAAGALNVLLQRSGNGGGGTLSNVQTAAHETFTRITNGMLAMFTANRADAQGNGAGTGRPIIRSAVLSVGTTAAPAQPLVIDLTEDGSRGVELRDNFDWLVVNLQKQAMPAGIKLHLSMLWTEERMPVVVLAGDSTTDFRAQGGAVWTEICHSQLSRVYAWNNHGSNGAQTLDYVNNANAPLYSLVASIGFIPTTWPRHAKHKMVVCYGINDVRQGACDLPTLIARLSSLIDTLRASRPECEVVMWGPNALSADNFGGNNYVATTGQFAGLTMAQAAQAATDMLYAAYESFRGDARVNGVVQKQDTTGRTALTVAASGHLNDQIHPNTRAQVKHAHALLASGLF